MRITSFVFLLILTYSVSAQLTKSIEVFTGLSEVEVDSTIAFDQWTMTTIKYPSGRIQDEVRIFISSDCGEGTKCNIKYQHQVYYDDENSTLALKEGKYLFIKNGKGAYRHFGWWYSNKGKIYRRVNEKTTKIL